MTFLKALEGKKQKGFTLIELMVVVAIVGILSAVAVPSYQKYQAKSRSSEAKLQLAAAYNALTAFQSEYNTYASCLREMGFDPTPEQSNRYYAVGFASVTTTLNGNAETAGAACPDGGAGNVNHLFPAGKQVDGTAAATTLPAGNVPTAGAFIAGAEGRILAGATQNDRWEITELKVVSNSQSGLVD